MFRRIVVAACLLLCLTTINKLSNAQTRRRAPVTKESSGQQEAEKFWSHYVATCGGSHYVKKRQGAIVELNGFHIVMSYDSLTEADRLNGIQAKGTSKYGASAHRFYLNGAWQPWRDGIPDDMTLVNSVRFQKTRGQWIFQGVGYFYDFATPVDCSDIPGQPGYGEHYGLELTDYCHAKYGNGATPVAKDGDAFSWRCMITEANGLRQYYEMDIDEACRIQHGSTFKAKLGDPADFRSWYCVSTSKVPIGGINIDPSLYKTQSYDKFGDPRSTSQATSAGKGRGTGAGIGEGNGAGFGPGNGIKPDHFPTKEACLQALASGNARDYISTDNSKHRALKDGERLWTSARRACINMQVANNLYNWVTQPKGTVFIVDNVGRLMVHEKSGNAVIDLVYPPQ